MCSMESVVGQDVESLIWTIYMSWDSETALDSQCNAMQCKQILDKYFAFILHQGGIAFRSFPKQRAHAHQKVWTASASSI